MSVNCSYSEMSRYDENLQSTLDILLQHLWLAFIVTLLYFHLRGSITVIRRWSN